MSNADRRKHDRMCESSKTSYSNSKLHSTSMKSKCAFTLYLTMADISLSSFEQCTQFLPTESTKGEHLFNEGTSDTENFMTTHDSRHQGTQFKTPRNKIQDAKKQDPREQRQDNGGKINGNEPILVYSEGIFPSFFFMHCVCCSYRLTLDDMAKSCSDAISFGIKLKPFLASKKKKKWEHLQQKAAYSSWS